LLALEGIHALEGSLDNLDILFAAGFRIIGLTHFFDNDAGGSAHGVNRGSLTPFGRELIERIQDRHMILDLAHASPRLLDDVLAITKKPVIVSHSGFQGIFNSPRNLSDDHARAISAADGLIGTAFFPETVGGKSIDAVARSIRYGVALTGIDHIALGSDFDGAIFAPIDAAGLPHLAAALSNTGFTDDEIRQIMGDNALRFLRQHLPNFVNHLSESYHQGNFPSPLIPSTATFNHWSW
jgi:microsomal dipeptidase-like Zn-dependent dipeptidase